MNSSHVTVVDYGLGNLYSVCQALTHCGAQVTLTDDPAVVACAERLVLPGVGAFANGMAGLKARGLDSAIQQFCLTERPLLGICLGMQMLGQLSEEFGEHAGLNLIPGRVTALPLAQVPYIGWGALQTDAVDWQKTLLRQTAPGTFVYLVHSYHFIANDADDVLATCNYDGHTITTAIQRGALTGVQFHPEKSGPAGLAMLSAFLSS